MSSLPCRKANFAIVLLFGFCVSKAKILTKCSSVFYYEFNAVKCESAAKERSRLLFIIISLIIERENNH